VDDEFY
jgi:hypothetical protein